MLLRTNMLQLRRSSSPKTTSRSSTLSTKRIHTTGVRCRSFGARHRTYDPPPVVPRQHEPNSSISINSSKSRWSCCIINFNSRGLQHCVGAFFSSAKHTRLRLSYCVDKSVWYLFRPASTIRTSPYRTTMGGHLFRPDSPTNLSPRLLLCLPLPSALRRSLAAV